MKQFALILVLGVICLAAYGANQGVFSIESPSFIDQNTLPVKMTCEGKNISPGISWQNIPENTKSLAFVIRDPDAPTGNFYHWIIYNIPPTLTSIPENMIVPRDKMIIGKNSYGKFRYNGPCPPKGETHLYVFTLYALDSLLQFPLQTPADELVAAIQDHTIKLVRLTAIYGR